MEPHGANKPGRVGWIDAARALGACSIVLLHVLVSTSLALDMSIPQQVAYTVVGILGCRWAVPAFFMLTGYLMLDPKRDVSYGSAIRHIKRVLIIIAVFGTTFALMEEVWLRLSAGLPIDVGVVPRAIADVFTMRTWDHLWFVYALLGVYAAVPPVRWVEERFGKTVYTVMTLVLFVLAMVLPTVFGGTMVSGPISSFLWNIAIGITCSCVGRCLHDFELSATWVALGVGSAIIMLVVSTAGVGAGVGDQGYIFLQGSCFACLYAIFVLLTIRWLVGDSSLDVDSPVSKLSRDSFGIYLIHPLFIHVGLLALREPPMIPVLYEAVFFAVVLVASIVATRVMRRAPVLKNVL